MAVYVENLRLMDAMSGEEIAGVPLSDAFRARFGNPYAVIHRGDLHGVLVKACQDSTLVDIQTSAEVVGYSQDENGVEAELATGAKVSGRGLIGADGLWSKVRIQVAGDGPPRTAGHTTYRTVIPTDEMPEDLRWNAATLWAGPKCHIVHYPLSDWKVFNLVVTYHNDAHKPEAGIPVEVEEVRQGFEHIHALPRKIIEHGSNWKRWVLCDRDPISNWVDDRVTLLGDAAHPMLQYMAQGACMALEDAVRLTHEVEAASGDLAKAFVAYRDNRVDRTSRVQIQARLMGDHIYHPDGAHAHLRNSILGAMSTEDYYDNLQWLYGGTGLETAIR